MNKVFKIVKDNNPNIRKKCEEINPITKEDIDFVNAMHEHLVISQDEKLAEKYKLRAGVGLAAPQVGRNVKALCVYYTYEDEDGNEVVVDHRLINPKIIMESVKLAFLNGGEGCLSVDNEHKGYVYRKYKIQVKAFDCKQEKEVIITAYGYEAIVLQHEIDHLSGILFYDHIDKKNPFKILEGAVCI